MNGLRGLLLACAPAVAMWAADWPQWRGPGRDGVSQETGLARQWPKEGPKLLWQVKDLGEGYATPAVAGGRLYVVANRGMENEYVQAMEAATGKMLWRTRIGNVGDPNQQPSYPMARSTPTVDGDVLYALSSDGDLACLRLRDGSVVWNKSLRSDFGGKPGKWAYAESPLVDGNTLVATPGGAEATLVALEKKTGALIWKSSAPGGDAAAYSSAIAVEAAGRRQYVQFLDKGVVGVDAKTGRFLWRYAKTSTGPANIPTPVAADGYVYSSNARRFGGGLVQLHASGDGVTAEEVYFERDVPNTLGGQVLVNGVLYGTNPKGLAAADYKTGKMLWMEETLGPGSVLYAAGLLFVHTENGEVVLAEAAKEGYREKGRFTPPDRPAHTRNREMAWSYPVLANGRLWIRDQDRLWCFDVAGK
ncbi:MAG: PQQ-binding-like beta-propeller repeat protein [Bryobacterales bacterium]|nr:PQQ-binding-like beta-propeller repeat protein [Bryobacterales bacterium]